MLQPKSSQKILVEVPAKTQQHKGIAHAACIAFVFHNEKLKSRRILSCAVTITSSRDTECMRRIYDVAESA